MFRIVAWFCFWSTFPAIAVQLLESFNLMPDDPIPHWWYAGVISIWVMPDFWRLAHGGD
jgi:hypothetical protein